MTREHNAKRAVRARMRATGERYTQARSALFGDAPSVGAPSAGSIPDRGGTSVVTQELLDALDRDGFVVVRDVVPKEVVDDLRQWVDGLVDEEMRWRTAEVERRRAVGESDVRTFPRGWEGRLDFPFDDDARRAPLVTGLADMAAAIGTPLASGGGIGVCLPGWGGHEGIHQDLDGPAPEAGRWDGAVVSWPLTAEAGMRVVPGSHRRPPVFPDTFAGAVAPQPDEVHVDAGPGDAVITSIHLWKSATLNTTSARRAGIWIGYLRDASVSEAIREYWARTPIIDGDAPVDPGNYVRRE
jgi:ectoine hydroxylase-related dioxygenase (phytanoyl-CoA dioxygenase family)